MSTVRQSAHEEVREAAEWFRGVSRLPEKGQPMVHTAMVGGLDVWAATMAPWGRAQPWSWDAHGQSLADLMHIKSTPKHACTNHT